MTIDNLAIDIVRLAVNVWLQVLIVVEMKGPSGRLKRLADRKLRNSGQTSGSNVVTHIARRQMPIDREQFVGIQCAPAVSCKLSL